MDTTVLSRTAAAMAALTLLAVVPACASQQQLAASPAPTADEVANMDYQGIEEAGGTVALRDGRWEGMPYAEGGASRPRVRIVPDSLATGDLDDDGNAEAVVLLSSSSGGSGTRSSVAVIARRDGRARNVATRLLGDRVQVRSLTVKDGLLTIDVVRAGPDDAACCPGELATYRWTLGAAGLGDARPPVVSGRLSASTLEGSDWVLRRFAYDEDAPAAPVVTLAFGGGQLRGTAGCNHYFAAISDKADGAAGAISLGPIASTQKMCPDPDMAVDDRYLRQLGSVSRFGYMNGRLMLDYEGGVMLFDRVDDPTQNAVTGQLP
jgi:heat shock protein HslJ